MFKLIRHLFGFSSARAIETGVSVLLLGIFSRIFTPAEFGVIAMLQIFSSIAGMIIDGRLNSAFSIKFYQDSQDQRTSRLYLANLYNLCMFVVFLGPFFIWPRVLIRLLCLPDTIENYTIYIVLLLTICRVVYSFFTNLLIIGQKPTLFVSVTTAFASCYLLLTVMYYLYYGGKRFDFMFTGQALALTICILIAAIFYTKNYVLSLSALKLKYLKEIIVLGLPLIPAGLVSLIQASADRYMLNWFGFLAGAGLYSVAARFPSLITALVMVPIGQTLTPITFKSYSRSVESYRHWQAHSVSFISLVTSLMAVLYIISVSIAYPLLIGADFQGTFPLTALLLLNTCILSIGRCFGNTLLVTGNTGKTFKLSVYATMCNILLNLLLIPRLHVYGAVIASIVGSIVEFGIYFRYSQRIMRIKYDYLLMIISGLIILSVTIFASVFDILSWSVFSRLAIAIPAVPVFCLLFAKTSSTKTFFGLVHENI